MRVQLQDRPHGGAEASGKAMCRNRSTQHRGKVAHRVLYVDLLGDRSSRGRNLCSLMDKRKGRGGQHGHMFHGTGGRSSACAY